MISLRKHTDDVLAALEAVFDPLDIAVGDADAGGLSAPYAVLYARPEGGFSGTLGRPTLKTERVMQVSCVGVTREQAEAVADKALTILSGLTITGSFVCRAHPEGAPPTFRDDDADPPLFVTPVPIRITSTSS